MAMGNPFEITMCEDSVKTVLIFLLAYAMGIGVYFSTRRNYRRREEHGSAKWGNAGALNKKYRDKDPSANKLLTQNVRIGLDGKKHRRNLNILVCGGSGAGKTRFKELVSDKYFAKEIEKRIGVQTDTTAIDKELANYESKLKEVDLNKARLEREIDNLPIDARFRERKIHDMTLRLDGLYDTIVELEERIEDAKLRKSSIEMETITLDNIYKLMLNFGKLYDIISDEEKKNLITYLIKEIQIYPNGESEMPLKSIEFNFPIYRDGQEVRRLLWEKGNTVETIVLLSKLKQKPA